MHSRNPTGTLHASQIQSLTTHCIASAGKALSTIASDLGITIPPFLPGYPVRYHMAPWHHMVLCMLGCGAETHMNMI